MNEPANFPLPKRRKYGTADIAKLVEQILAAKKKNPASDTSAWEREIDQQVCALYGLTPEEIKIVEAAAR